MVEVEGWPGGGIMFGLNCHYERGMEPKSTEFTTEKFSENKNIHYIYRVDFVESVFCRQFKIETSAVLSLARTEGKAAAIPTSYP